jgi:CheY-like chemotaxis protein
MFPDVAHVDSQMIGSSDREPRVTRPSVPRQRPCQIGGGQEGIDAFRKAAKSEEPFALVITDLGRPYIDGRKVASAIKSDSPSTPVVLLTGWGQRPVAEGDVPPNVDCVLNKPPKPGDLRAALADLASGVAVPQAE